MSSERKSEEVRVRPFQLPPEQVRDFVDGLAAMLADQLTEAYPIRWAMEAEHRSKPDLAHRMQSVRERTRYGKA